VPHVHVHILPRRLQDDRFARSQPDEVYVELERPEGVHPQGLAAPPGLSLSLALDLDHCTAKDGNGFSTRTEDT